MTTPNGTDDAQLVAQLAARCRDVAAGGRLDLDDLEARDQCGPALFAALALRFGCRRDDEGHWVRERVPRWTPGWVQSHHEEQWMRLFEAAFGYRMDAKLWRWKYRHDPLHGMGAWRDGELVAFYGGMTRHAMHFGRRECVVQIGDIMTHPDERAAMTRQGPYHIATTTFIERSVGYGMPFLFGYGFPTEISHRIGERLRVYDEVDQMVELAWSPSDSFAAGVDALVPFEASRAATVDRLWKAMDAATRTSVVGIRDSAYIADRYGTHPVNRYECALVVNRFTRIAKGLVVWRDRGDDGLEVLDLVGDPQRWPDLVRAVRRWLAHNGRQRAFMWVSESHAAMLAPTSPTSHKLNLVVPANIWTPGPAPAELRGHWWLTGGDTDIR